MKLTFSSRARLSAGSTPEFDPALPQNGALVVAGVLRDQFNSLFALIQAIQNVDAAQIDSVQTLPPGQPAAVSVSVSDNTLHFTFSIPRGYPGEPGEPGPPGEVTEQQLVDAMNTRAHSISGLSPLELNPDPYYNSDQIEEIVNKVNELIFTLGQE